MGNDDKIRGWKIIADKLQCSTRTAQSYAALAKDPLPVRHDRKGPYVLATVLAEWDAAHDRSHAEHVAARQSA